MGYKNEDRIGVGYRDVTRTPSPTPSEAETLANKTRTCNISSFKKYMHLSYFKEPKNLSACSPTVARHPFPDCMRQYPSSSRSSSSASLSPSRSSRTTSPRLCDPLGTGCERECPSAPHPRSPRVLIWDLRTPGAWLIPIGIMVILSFPPLFGHELVALLCGEFWGLYIGFGIVAAGTILGELVTY